MRIIANLNSIFRAMKQPGIIILFIIHMGTLVGVTYERTDKLRAVYMYKLGFFISTRPVDDVIQIGVIGEDPLMVQLTNLQGTKGFEQKYIIVEFDTIEDYRPMHVVYMPGRFYTQEKMKELLTHQSLVVGNDEFCWLRGYHVCLFQKNEKLVFKINKTQMDKTGISLSAKVMILADEIR